MCVRDVRCKSLGEVAVKQTIQYVLCSEVSFSESVSWFGIVSLSLFLSKTVDVSSLSSLSCLL
jgi:hypothetical protein